MKKGNQKPVIEEIIITDVKDGNEHCYVGKFHDGYAELQAAPDEEGVHERLLLTYPTVSQVEKDKESKRLVNEYSGLDPDAKVKVYPIAVKFGRVSEFGTIHEKLLNDLLDAIDYSFLQTDGDYDRDLTYCVIDKVKYIKNIIKQ